MTVTRRPITAENWEQCVRLVVEPEQEHFVVVSELGTRLRITTNEDVIGCCPNTG